MTHQASLPGLEVDSSSSWKDLPGAFLCHILQIIPTKRAEVKAVCSSWRTAINSSLNEVKIPAADLPLLQQLPNIKHLIVTGTGHTSTQRQQHTWKQSCTWPPAPWVDRGLSAAHSAAADDSMSLQAPTGCSDTRCDVGQINCWEAVEPRLLNRLRTLRLLHCPNLAQHLAAGLWQSIITATCSSGSSSSSSSSRSWAAPLPAFTTLEVLELTSPGNISPLLAALSEQRAASAQQQHSNVSSPSSAPAAGGAALDQLQQLHLVDWSLDCCYRGCTASKQLQLLSQLPALHTLQLSGCGWLYELPAAVLDCGGLTRLLLCNNTLLTELPAGLDKLTALQVLHLSGNSMLRSLGPSFSKLTSLTELNLSGPSGLWADFSTTAAGGGEQNSGSTAAGEPASAAAALLVKHAGPSSLAGPGQLSTAAPIQPWWAPLPHQQQQLLLPELASLQQLRHLVLSFNRQLAVLPAAVSALTGLARLEAMDCALRWLGDDVLGCTALHELALGYNLLVDLPEEISSLQELRVLNLSGCTTLWHLPDSLLRLSQLERIAVPNKYIGQYILEQLECRQNAVQVHLDFTDEGECSFETVQSDVEVYDD